MAPQPVVTGLSPKEGPPGTKVVIRGEFLGTRPSDFVGLTICDCDCLLSAEWKSSNKIIAHTGVAKGKGDIIVTTLSGGVGTSTVQFRAYHETIGPMKESAVWIEESPMPSLAWGRRTLAPVGYTREDPLGLSIEGNEKKFPEDLRDLFPEESGDVSMPNFSPGWFLLENHHATSFDDLKAGLAFLKRKVESQKEGQLSFLKSNAGSVIDQLDTLIVIRDKFCDDSKNMGNICLESLEAIINGSISNSDRIFKDVLIRREKAESKRLALTAFNRYKFLFSLPKTIDQKASTGEYDIVVNDFSRAKNLFGKTDIVVFRTVIDEVESRVFTIAKELHNQVIKMPQSVDHQKKLIKALLNLQLQQTGTNFRRNEIADPAWDAIEARADYLENFFKKLYEQHSAKENTNDKTRNRDAIQPPNRLLFCEEMCDIAAVQLPDIWRLGQSYFAGEIRGLYDRQPGDFKRIILSKITQFCQYLHAAIFVMFEARTSRQLPTWSSSPQPMVSQFLHFLPQCLRFIRTTYATLIQLDLPSEALDIIQKLINDVRIFCLSTIFKRSVDRVKRLEKEENWIATIEEFPGATNLTILLEEIIIDLLEEGQNTCLNPEIRESSILEANSEAQQEVSDRLNDILETFCNVIENLAYQLNDEESHSPAISQLIGFPTITKNEIVDDCPAVTWKQRMLCCLANCAYCHKIFFSHIGMVFLKYGYPLPTTAIELSKSSISQLFANLLEVYVEHKGDPLVGTIEPSMYLGNFQWNTVNHCNELSPYAQECCDNLSGVYSEIFSISPLLLSPILHPIVQTVAEELARLMSCVENFSVVGAIQANVDIRVLRDSLSAFSNNMARSFFAEAIDAIRPCSSNDDITVQKILEEIKERMSLHLQCFSISNF